MNKEQAYGYLNEIERRGSVPGLDAIKSMLKALCNPEKNLKVIHVTGTNGKGSFCAIMAEILVGMGYKVGVFTSPFLTDIREMISINGEIISEDEITRLTERLCPVSEALPTPLTQFEFMTALCMEYFKESKVDFAIVEVGMGGELDATNVFERPLLSVITGVSVDHVSFLGSTVSQIAIHKGGIIKEGCPVYYGGKDPQAGKIIKSIAEQKNADYYGRDEAMPEITSIEIGKTEFLYMGEGYSLSLAGEYQVENAAKVIDSCRILNNYGLNISKDDIQRGFSKLVRRGRFEIVSHSPTVIYDGGHNAECAAALVKSIKAYFGDKKINVIMGVLADKDYTAMVNSISDIAVRVYTVTPNNKRALDGRCLAVEFRKIGIPAFFCSDYCEALERWMDSGCDELLVTGSLYTYGDFIRSFEKIKNSMDVYKA